MNRLLLIIDPQIDFITGSLPVPGAVESMNALAGFLTDCDGAYKHKIVTADRHPYRHLSFDREGGPWSPHCIHDTVGAAIWPSLIDPLYATRGHTTILYKGQRPDREEYSIFQNRDAAASITTIIEANHIGHIDICGLAGDICVLESLRDGLNALPTVGFRVLTSFTPSLDGGKALGDAINTFGLCTR